MNEPKQEAIENIRPNRKISRERPEKKRGRAGTSKARTEVTYELSETMLAGSQDNQPTKKNVRNRTGHRRVLTESDSD